MTDAWTNAPTMQRDCSGLPPFGLGRTELSSLNRLNCYGSAIPMAMRQRCARSLVTTALARSNVQGLVNSLRWAVDGTIQGATSSSGAELKGGEVTADAGKSIVLRGRDFTLDPLNKSLEPASGGGQHGMCFNRWATSLPPAIAITCSKSSTWISGSAATPAAYPFRPCAKASLKMDRKPKYIALAPSSLGASYVHVCASAVLCQVLSKAAAERRAISPVQPPPASWIVKLAMATISMTRHCLRCR